MQVGLPPLGLLLLAVLLLRRRWQR
eukprot:COSAG06_NODE_32054_length_512_cov_0.697337_1_plen_24_part_10